MRGDCFSVHNVIIGRRLDLHPKRTFSQFTFIEVDVAFEMLD